ncbi:MAG: 50S ribosomal protein L17 [Cyclobacteriaceae bacterium]
MRHGKKFNHLGRTASHREAMLSNMASSLIINKRINTTLAKAKALRKYVEPIITKAKTDTTHSRRIAFSYLQNKESVQELFGPVAEKIANRPGGYVRIIKTGNRLGDSAEMCMMELVDFNEMLLGDAAAKPKTRRSRRGGSGKGKSAAETSAAANVEEAKVVEETKEEKAEAKAEKVEAKAEVAEPSKEEVKEEAPKEEKKVEAKAEEPAEEKKEEKSDDSAKEGEDKSEKKD